MVGGVSLNQYEIEMLWVEGGLPDVTYMIEFPDGTSESAIQSEVERALL